MTLDPHATIETEAPASTELRDLARVVKAAIGVAVHHWTFAQRLPTQHPYRQAASMVVRYLERRYGV